MLPAGTFGAGPGRHSSSQGSDDGAVVVRVATDFGTKKPKLAELPVDKLITLKHDIENMTLESMKAWAVEVGHTTGNEKALPWTAVAAMVPYECSKSNKAIKEAKSELCSKLSEIGLNDEMKNSPGLWKSWSDILLHLGIVKPWPSIVPKQLAWLCRVYVLTQLGKPILR